MKAPASAQLRLLDLQAEDTAIAQLQHRKTALPEHAALAEGKAQRAKLAAALVGATTQVGDLTQAVEKAEADLVPVRERLVRDQGRLEAGVVNEARAIGVLQDEIAHLEHRISDLEDVELETMEQLDAATTGQRELVAQIAELDSSLQALAASRDEQSRQLDVELAEHQARRDADAAEIPADLLSLYDRVRAKAGGLGAAELKGRRCSGCQLEATASALAGYAAAGPDEVLRCEECDRILVRTAPDA